MTLYRAYTTRGRLEVQGADGPVVFTTVPALYDMTNEEANALSRKWGDRVICEVMDDPPETRDDDQQITGAKPSGRVLPQEPEPEAPAEATEPDASSGPEVAIEETSSEDGSLAEDGDPTAQAEPPAEEEKPKGRGPRAKAE